MAAQVLIVDDDPDIVTAIQVNLELEGYGVHVAHDGSEAVEIARQVRPDVVLLDVVMPGVDGHEVLHALHGDTRTGRARSSSSRPRARRPPKFAKASTAWSITS